MSFDIAVANDVQDAFREIIVPFERYLAKAKTSGVTSAHVPAKQTSMRMGAASADRVKAAASMLNDALPNAASPETSTGALHWQFACRLA